MLRLNYRNLINAAQVKLAVGRLLMNLVLHLKFEYYDQIKRGEKLEEYRLAEKWEKRIVGKNFDNVVLWRGYQSGVFMVLPWQGYTRKTITHPHFGNAPVEVFAINVRAKQSAHLTSGGQA